MKPLHIIAALLSAAQMQAAEPVSTYTFADPCTPHVTASAMSDSYGCYSFTASNSLLPGQTGGTYTWQFGDGQGATGTIVAHCYNPVTVTTVFTGTLQYISPALCGPVPDFTTFTITLSPVPPGSCVVQGSEVLLSQNSVTVQEGPSIPEVFRTINFGDGPGFSATNKHTYSGCGPFLITEKKWTMLNNSDTCYAYTAVNIQCVQVPAGLQETAMHAASVVPNPFRNEFMLTSGKKIAIVILVDLPGNDQSVTWQWKEDGCVFYTEGLKAGFYILKIKYLDNTVDFIKVIRE
jgi:hypothetical protein